MIMRLPRPLSLSFSGITSRYSLHSRFFASDTASGSAPPSHRHTYFVPRNSRGSLPVYSDVRNGGTQYLISVRSVQGNIKVCDPVPHDRSLSHLPSSQKALSDDLLRDLSDPKSTTESSLIKARITRSKQLVLSGLRRKHAVLDWLVRQGF